MDVPTAGMKMFHVKLSRLRERSPLRSARRPRKLNLWSPHGLIQIDRAMSKIAWEIELIMRNKLKTAHACSCIAGINLGLFRITLANHQVGALA